MILKKSESKSSNQKSRKNQQLTNGIVVIVVVMGVVTLGSQYLNSAGSSISLVQVPVANQTIIANTVITEDMITIDKRYTEDIKKYNPKEMLAVSPEDIIGMRSTMPIYPGEPINRNRITRNTTAMDEYSAGLSEVSLVINDGDKGLSFDTGSFVDIWQVPTSGGATIGLTPNKIISNVQLVGVANSDGMDITNYHPEAITSETYIPAGYFTVYLTNAQQSALYSVDTKSYTLRVAKHTANDMYNDIQSLMDASNSAGTPNLDPLPPEEPEELEPPVEE